MRVDRDRAPVAGPSQPGPIPGRVLYDVEVDGYIYTMAALPEAGRPCD